MWFSQLWMLLLYILLSSSRHIASGRAEGENNSVKTSVYLSPPFYLKHGLVQDKHYYDVPFPRGHIALKSFNGEVVDENGNPIPLHETYLHHWRVERYYGKKHVKDGDSDNFIFVRNSGPCKNAGQYFGLGSETRKTDTWVPDPYGIVVGNPDEIPEGYEEKWLLNVHAIDTRNVEDRLGCTECKCSLYNVTIDQYGRPLAKGYVGGFNCCYDETQCRVEEGFNGGERKLYLRYTVKWVEWNPRIIPIKIYILDVTDAGDYPPGSSAVVALNRCKLEYTVPSCDSNGEDHGECVDIRKTKVVLPHGGDIIYGVAHQHTGGTGSALYGEDGQLLCTSNPLYGEGEEAGDEAGYIVGMSTCYPKPGSLNIRDGELLTLVSNYSSLRMHTGVMGMFYILLAEPQPKLSAYFSQGLTILGLVERWWVLLLAGGIMVVVAAAAIYRREREREREMGSRMPKEISFPHNGQDIRAILVDDPPAGGWTLEQICSICNHPLGDQPFFTTDPLLVYVHAHCAWAAAVAAYPPAFQSPHLSGDESRHIAYFSSAPPSNSSHQSYNNSYPNQSYNYGFNYQTYQPPPNYYYSQLYQNYPPLYNYPGGYHPSYNQYPPPPPPPSLPVWISLAVRTVLEPLLESLFSSLFST